MRSSLHLACVFCFDQAQAASAVAMDRRFQHAIEPLLALLEANERLQAVVHIGGRLLDHAAGHRPQVLGRITALHQQGRLELLGGAFYSPVLSAIPEKDAMGQVRFATNWLKRNLNIIPTGAWLPLRAWDPTLPGVLSQAGVRYTLIDDAQFFGAGLQPVHVHGHFVNHRAGNSVSLFPIDRRLTEAAVQAPIEGARQVFERTNEARQDEGDQVAVLAFDGDEVVGSGRAEQLFAMFVEDHHWLKTITLSRAFDAFPTRGPISLLTGADPDLAEWACTAEARERRRYLQYRLDQAHAWSLVRYHVDRVIFDNFLIKYAEANHLHKRMLAVSENIDRLRTVLAERRITGRVSETDTHARKVLERACDALWRAQSHASYWHKGKEHPGIYSPQLRISTTRQLMKAQHMVEKALGDPAKGGWWAGRRDYDADGNPEALVVSRELSAVVHAAQGGTLWELDMRRRQIPLQTGLSPVEEPYDDQLIGNEVTLVDTALSHERLRAIPKTNPGSPPPRRTWEFARRRVDRVPRGAFQDRVLGPETTLDTFARRQFRELGDFAEGRFELTRIAEPEPEEPMGVVQVVRSGVAKDVDRTMLLRVSKEYRFDPFKPRMVLDHAVVNRSRDTVTMWHGLEWTLGLPSGSELNLWATGFMGNRERTYQLIDGPQDLGVLTWLEVKDMELELSVVMETPDPVRVWWTPVVSVYETQEGWQEVVQGQTLLFHRDLEIWGEDTASMQLTFDFLAD